MGDFVTGKKLCFLSVERLNLLYLLYAYRPNAIVVETANATNAPGTMLKNRDSPTGINDFHVAHAHAHEGALHKTAKKMGVNVVGKMQECKGCSLTKKGYQDVNSI